MLDYTTTPCGGWAFSCPKCDEIFHQEESEWDWDICSFCFFIFITGHEKENKGCSDSLYYFKYPKEYKIKSVNDEENEENEENEEVSELEIINVIKDEDVLVGLNLKTYGSARKVLFKNIEVSKKVCSCPKGKECPYKCFADR
jgi:hypothetical protein